MTEYKVLPIVHHFEETICIASEKFESALHAEPLLDTVVWEQVCRSTQKIGLDSGHRHPETRLPTTS